MSFLKEFNLRYNKPLSGYGKPSINIKTVLITHYAQIMIQLE
jgi:hypothetical protein